MNDGYKLIALQEHRKLFVCDAPRRKALQQRGSYQHDPNPRLRQPLVYGAEKWLAKSDIIFTKPDRHSLPDEKVIQLLGGPLPVVPCVAQEDVPKIG